MTVVVQDGCRACRGCRGDQVVGRRETPFPGELSRDAEGGLAGGACHGSLCQGTKRPVELRESLLVSCRRQQLERDDRTDREQIAVSRCRPSRQHGGVGATHPRGGVEYQWRP